MKTNLELDRVVMGGSGGYRWFPGGSDHFSWHTDRQTLHHNIYIITIIIKVIMINQKWLTRSGDPESPGQGPPRSLPTAQSLPGANCCAHSLSRTRLTLGMWGGLCSGLVEVEVKHSLPKASCSAHSLSVMMSWSWLIFDGCSVMLRGRFSRTNHCIGCTTQASLRQLWNNFETT